MSRLKDEVGNRYSHLVVIDRAENTKNGQAQWLCRCDCGNECVVSGSNLRRGLQVSCGCYGKTVRAKNDVPTKFRQTRLYRIWGGMKSRCNDPRNNRYKNYGGRGISICEEWQADFMAFYRWAMANNYSDELSMDRIDNDGNYEPNNCRWATMKEQMRNKRNNQLITYNGETKCMTDWCKEFGLKLSTISARIHAGWSSPQEILFGKTKGV